MSDELRKKIERNEEFQLERRIESGATGNVYSAIRTLKNPLCEITKSKENQLVVALKVVPFSNTCLKCFFKNEVKSLYAFTSPLSPSSSLFYSNERKNENNCCYDSSGNSSLSNRINNNINNVNNNVNNNENISNNISNDQPILNNIVNENNNVNKNNNGNTDRGENEMIVRIYSHYNFIFRGEQYGVIEMEKMDMDLMKYIETHQRVDEEQTRFVFKSICSAIAKCHSAGYCHLDLKPDNVLISLGEYRSISDSQFNQINNNNNDNINNNNNNNYGNKYMAEGDLENAQKIVILKAKLADFGFAVKKNRFKSNTPLGTKEYLPIEVFMSQNQVHPEKIDIWGLGILLYIMLTGVLSLYL